MTDSLVQPSDRAPDPRLSLQLQSRTGFPSRAIAEGLFRDRRRVLLAATVMLGVSIALALVVSPKYIASAELLVLPSADYGAQSNAGGAAPPPSLLERDTYLKNEVEILTSASLAKATIREIGLARLDPHMADGPGVTTRILAAVAEQVRRSKTMLGLHVRPPRQVDPIDLEAASFTRDLTAVADKTGNVILVSFRHGDAAIAADVVNTLVSLYLGKRAELYQDTQAAVVTEQAGALQTALAAASATYADFKARHHIFDYDTQRDILLHQRGDIARDLQQAGSAIDQANRRLGALQSQIAATPPEIVLYTETDQQTQLANLKTSLQNLKIKEAGLALHELAAERPLQEARAQIRATEADIERVRSSIAPSLVRRGRNTVLDTLEIDRAQAQQDAEAAIARRDADTTQLAQVEAAVAQLEGSEAELRRLERQKGLVEASYAATVRTLGDRQLAESISARKVPNVRIIQPAEAPIAPPRLRLIILAGGIMLSLFAGIFVAVLSQVLRRGYLCAETLERGLGIPVLATIPERANMAQAIPLLRDDGYQPKMG